MIDGDWRTTITDEIAGQIRDAGFNVERLVISGSTFRNDWTNYPFLTTNWGSRPLVVQVYGFVYRPGEAWSDSGHTNPDFGTKLSEAMGIADADKRSEIMANLKAMLQSSGTIIQPFWMGQYLHNVAEVKNFFGHKFREMHLEKVWIDA